VTKQTSFLSRVSSISFCCDFEGLKLVDGARDEISDFSSSECQPEGK
jgi:hypothetical protein